MLKQTNSRKSQSAMESLMSYGWVIIVLVIVIAVLIGLSVLKPEQKLGENLRLDSTAVLAPTFGINDQQNPIFVLENNDPEKPMSNVRISLDACNDASSGVAPEIPPGDKQTFIVHCPNKEAMVDGRLKSGIKVYYDTITPSSEGGEYKLSKTVVGLLDMQVPKMLVLDSQMVYQGPPNGTSRFQLCLETFESISCSAWEQVNGTNLWYCVPPVTITAIYPNETNHACSLDIWYTLPAAVYNAYVEMEGTRENAASNITLYCRNVSNYAKLSMMGSINQELRNYSVPNECLTGLPDTNLSLQIWFNPGKNRTSFYSIGTWWNITSPQ
jgi:hypothetical protein